MNDKEIKKAVNLVHEYGCIKALAGGEENQGLIDAFQTLINSAQLYLSIAGKMPEEKTGKDENFSFLYQQHLPLAIEVYNQARQECVLAFMKALPSVELENVYNKYSHLDQCLSDKFWCGESLQAQMLNEFWIVIKNFHAQLEGSEMPEKSLKEILEKLLESQDEMTIDNFPDVKNKIIYQAAQAIRDYYLAKLPAEKAKPDKNDICISCKKHIDICNCELNYTWNDCIAEMRRAIEEG